MTICSVGMSKTSGYTLVRNIIVEYHHTRRNMVKQIVTSWSQMSNMSYGGTSVKRSNVFHGYRFVNYRTLKYIPLSWFQSRKLSCLHNWCTQLSHRILHTPDATHGVLQEYVQPHVLMMISWHVTICELLAFCEGNPPVTNGFPQKDQ